jgi:uncharacterized membrane protein YjgN (DUF898 family)
MDTRAQQDIVTADFAGEAREFFGLVVRGSLLQIPTFGFYRFWLLTDIRRHLWANTRFGADSPEYTGRAKELLIGFLIALAILAPVYLIYFLISLEAERLQAFASLPFFLILYVLGYYASYRARRYRATRTVFRGLRFSMTGSGWAYTWRAILWDLLSVLTLGLAYPWRTAALERYRTGHTHYGDLPGAFVGSGWTFFKRGWWLWLIGMILLLGMAILTSALIVPAMLGQSAGLVVVFAIYVLVVVLGLGLIVWPMFRAIQLKWRLDGINFGDAALKSELSKGSIVRCYLKAWLAGFALVVVLGLANAAAVWMFGGGFDALGRPGTTPPPAFVIGMVLVYLAVLIGFGVIKLYFLDRGVWAAAVNSLAVINMSALDAAVARGEAAGSVGEGLVDALDFGGGL